MSAMWGNQLSRLLGVAIMLSAAAFSASPAHAQGYVGPRRTVTLAVTGGAASDQPFCDVFVPSVNLSINNESSPPIPMPLSSAGAGGLDIGLTILAGGFPVCLNYSGAWETFALQPATQLDDLSCAGSLYTFEVDMRDDDGGTLEQKARLSWTVDLDDPDAVLEGCHDEIANGQGGFCWKISVEEEETGRDADGDGLTDLEETRGVDFSCDGILQPGEDLFLHQMGVSPTHKDMLLQMNWFSGYEPLSPDLVELKGVFARAPVDAGGLPNPDGQLGINLVIDAGNVFSDVGVHSAAGRDLGSANNSPGSSAELEAFMATIEDTNRIGRFRHMIFGPLLTGGIPDAVAGRSVGNDRVQLESRSVGTMLHELGHALGLLHGGESPQEPQSLWPAFTLIDSNEDGAPERFDLNGDGAMDAWPADLNGDGISDAAALDANGDGIPESLDRFAGGQNCKPNHLSAMNYLYQGSIPFETGGKTLFFADFSPSKIPDERLVISSTAQAQCPANSFGCNRRLPLVPMLDEQNLDETVPLLASDYGSGILVRHLMMHLAPSGTPVMQAMDGARNWDADVTTNFTNYVANVDMRLNDTSEQGCGAASNQGLQRLVNVDEWSKVELAPGRGALGSSQGSAGYFEDRHAPFPDSRDEEVRVLLLETALSVSAELSPQPIAIGAPAVLTVEVTNQGPNAASDGFVEVTFPQRTAVLSAPASCEQVAALRFACSTAVVGPFETRPMPAGTTQSWIFNVSFSPAPAGTPATILVSASHEGEEPSPEDNTAALSVVTQPAFLGFEDGARPWVKAYGAGNEVIPTTSAPVTGGAAALRLPCGNTQFESATFDTAELGIVGSRLALDVYVPLGVSPGYAGDLQLALHVPSAQIYNAWIGRIDFGPLPRGTWSQVEFQLTNAQVQVLLGDYPDARLRFGANVANCALPIFVDSLRFEGVTVVRTLAHPSGRAVVSSSSVLTFDHGGDWMVTSGSAQLTSATQHVQGTAGLGAAVSSWARIESRKFTGAEVGEVSSVFALDFLIPALPPDYGWLGQMSIFLTCSSLSIYNSYVGTQPLQVLFDGEYNQLRFAFPSDLQGALSGGTAECAFALEISSNQSLGAFALDNGGFVP